jgi:hypothetical protein
MEHVFSATNDDSVAGIVASLTAYDDFRPFGEEVDDFTFAFIAPLGAYENGVSHGFGEMRVGEENRLTVSDGVARQGAKAKESVQKCKAKQGVPLERMEEFTPKGAR